MPFPEREQLKNALLRMMAEARGEVSVDADRVSERLADEFNLSPQERSEVYKSGVNRLTQLLRMVRSSLIEEGLMDKNKSRGIWKLTPLGITLGQKLWEEHNSISTSSSFGRGDRMQEDKVKSGDVSIQAGVTSKDAEMGSETLQGDSASSAATTLIQEEDSVLRDSSAAQRDVLENQKTSVPFYPGGQTTLKFYMDGMEELGFSVEGAKALGSGFVHVFSSLPSVQFDVDVWLVQGVAALIRNSNDRELLIIDVATPADIDSHFILSEGVMRVNGSSLEQLFTAHRLFPFPLDEVVNAFRGSAAKGDDSVLKLAKSRSGTLKSVELAALLLQHSKLRIQYGENLLFKQEELYWFLFGDPAKRGIYSREDVKAALEVLSSPTIGAFRKQEDTYVQVMSVDNALRTFQQWARYLPAAIE